MKDFYESRYDISLTRRMPVILRLDGKAMHSFTKGFERPYDNLFHSAMNKTLQYLCQNIQGCKFGYTQSDEISLLLVDFENLDSDAWFDYRVQKVSSVAAGMATLAFNKFFARGFKTLPFSVEANMSEQQYKIYQKAIETGAVFDCRCFNIPREDVTNYFVWRQQDATKNAIQMLGQCHFSHKELQNKSGSMIQDMLFQQKGINFNDMPVEFKRGVACKRIDGRWAIDMNMPIITQDRNYVELMIPTI